MRTYAEPTHTYARRPTWFVFVGQRRSRRAIEMGVHWEHGRLCAKTLHEALRAIGLDPRLQTFLNAYTDADPPAVNQGSLVRVRTLAEAGAEIVTLGRAAHRALARAGIPHRQLIHPAARGAIRARAAYHAHVAAVLQ